MLTACHPVTRVRSARVIAYLVLVHRYPEQFKRLFKAIYDPRHVYLIHADANAGSAFEADIGAFLDDYPNAEMLDSKPAVWGAYSLVDAELRGMAQLLRMGKDWEVFINLSGQDFPLKSQKAIRAYLARHRGTEFIKVLDQQKLRPDTMSRVTRLALELTDRMHQTQRIRPFIPGKRPYIGNQWMIVSRAFCEFVCHDPRATAYKDFYKNTFIADEGFFQTVMMNNPVHGKIVSDDLRMIDWVPDGPIKLRPRTFTTEDADALLESPALFARKFDASVDADILSLLEERIGLAPAVAPHIAVRHDLEAQRA
jgi:hypothetical protein